MEAGLADHVWHEEELVGLLSVREHGGMKYHPIPLRALLCIYGFGLTVGYWRWRWALRRISFSRKAMWLMFGFALAIFLLIAILNAIQNNRLGLPQF